jgi:hypothetical protein
MQVALVLMRSMHLAVPQQRPLRILAVLFILACALWSAIADAIIINLNNRATTRLSIRVGGGGNTISEVSFSVPATQLGNSTAITGTPDIRFRLQIRASGASPVTASLSVDSPASLENTDIASSSSIPFSDISWVSRDGDIPSGSFAGTGPGQHIVDVQSSQRYIDFHTFSYANTATLEAGTYEGRVIYTFAAP